MYKTMTEDMREMLAEEMGLSYCPIANQYMGCDNGCDECQDYIEFCECVIKELKEEE